MQISKIDFKEFKSGLRLRWWIASLLDKGTPQLSLLICCANDKYVSIFSYFCKTASRFITVPLKFCCSRLVSLTSPVTPLNIWTSYKIIIFLGIPTLNIASNQPCVMICHPFLARFFTKVRNRLDEGNVINDLSHTALLRVVLYMRFGRRFPTLVLKILERSYMINCVDR